MQISQEKKQTAFWEISREDFSFILLSSRGSKLILYQWDERVTFLGGRVWRKTNSGLNPFLKDSSCNLYQRIKYYWISLCLFLWVSEISVNICESKQVSSDRVKFLLNFFFIELWIIISYWQTVLVLYIYNNLICFLSNN